MAIFPFLSHAIISVVYSYAIYVYVYGLIPPKEIESIRNTPYGAFKYLTFWDLLLQFLFFFLCTISDMTAPQKSSKKNKAALRSLLDFMFTTIVFSTAAFVATSFWLLYSIDRELIFPVIYDSFFPSWLNHVVHTLPLTAVILELIYVNHPFPSQRKGFFTVTLFTLLYLGWVLFIASTTGHWVYPILAKLSDVGRAGFIAAMCVLIGIFYILGYGLQALSWGHPVPDQELIYHKRK